MIKFKLFPYGVLMEVGPIRRSVGSVRRPHAWFWLKTLALRPSNRHATRTVKFV